MSIFLRFVTSACLLLGLLVTTSCAQDDPKSKKDDSKAKPEPKVVDKDGKTLENPFPNRFPAPSLEGGSAWLNTSGEITLKDVRGKIVLIDFWTYCCINCMHVLPDLKFLEQKYPNEVVVIGCHSAKFDNEKDTEAIRRAIVRYEIEHPVINDSEMTVWRKFNARSWPTLVLIDPEGQYCGYISGEGHREVLDEVVARLIAYHKAKGTLDQTPVRFDLERNKVKSGALKFPGKLLADEPGNRLFISDSNHNRIVISSLDGKLIDTIGNGQIGKKDGSYADAMFDHPQGMVLHQDTLYVADTENHSIRTVNLKTKQVATLAGTGQQARFRASGGELSKVELNSPWDLTIVDDTLYIAMAGPHQLWSHVLGSKKMGVFAGNGREDIVNGSLEESAFAQPSGITSDGKYLYVADSEGSSIRKVPIDPSEKVTTIVGEHDLPRGATLFEFGDVDGVGKNARLQHPLGVLFHDGKLFVADSYNHKIKVIDVAKRESASWLGNGKIGTELSPVSLHEPAGMTAARGKLYIADTNNHRILIVDPKEKKPAATVFEVAGLVAPKPVASVAEAIPANAKIATVAAQKVVGGKSVKLKVTFKLPESFKLNPEYPLRARLAAEGTQALVAADTLAKSVAGTGDGDTATFEIPLAAESGSGKFVVSVSYSYCRDGVGGVCKLDTARWSLPIEIAADGAKQIELNAVAP
jgi:thiol-disulfide isomerase/thioredoxin